MLNPFNLDSYPSDDSLPGIQDWVVYDKFSDPIAHGEVVNEYNNPNLFPGRFPSLYPLGIGGFDELQHKNKISFRAQAEYYLDVYNCSF